MVDPKLLAYLEEFVSLDRLARFHRILEKRTTYLTVALEDVYHMHNTSAIIRSCDVFGVQEIHVVEDRFKQRLDKKIALGAQQWVNIIRHRSPGDCIAHLKTQGYDIVAATPDRDSCTMDQFAFTRKTALFFGTEKDGLSDTVRKEADCYVNIPMVGFTESLNVSVSAAILIQSLSARLRESTLPWQLTEAEKRRIRFDWVKGSIKSADAILERYGKGS